MADSMEIMLLSILGPVLSCQWGLKPWEQALLTTMVMLGMTTGSSFWGKMSDKHGRKTIFFAVGAVVEVLLALVVMPTLGWRYLMAFSAIPVIFFPILSPVGEQCRKYNVMFLLLVSIFCRFLLGFSYYGMALLLPTLLNKPDGCHGSDVEVTTKETCSVKCEPFTEQDYVELAITSFADAPGLLVAYLLQLVMQRRSCISLIAITFSAFLFLSNICLNRSTLTAFMFVSRGMISGAHQLAFVYTSECYPTNVRALGMGINSGLTRLGAVLTPYVAQVGTQWSAYFSFIFYGVVGLLAALFSAILPFDTKGRAMVDISH
ncbi:hypothetical protein EGW08_006354 [Elysia chlorotica]|uniref:Major facilitator superfamily (MFS) profile domain-containing protein n=1 Tax=Elysia chlorotica TaxID=188477 RepID=A0A3S1BKG8_ELYCH|nr:hypothetical protein EGW08_006354 [Elysia chlorotica]